MCICVIEMEPRPLYMLYKDSNAKLYPKYVARVFNLCLQWFLSCGLSSFRRNALASHKQYGHLQ